MIPYPTAFDSNTRPLAKARLGDKGLEAIEQLETSDYEVHTGLTPEFADDIARMALEPSIREYCPNDCGQRFANRASTERWLSKARATFLLLKHTADGNLVLAGYGWSGSDTSSHVPAGETTFALRIGEAGQGQGLAAPFARLIILASVALYGAKSLWLETWQSNGGAVHVYQKLGFEIVAEVPDQRLTLNGQKVPDTRLYMSLPSNPSPTNEAALSSNS